MTEQNGIPMTVVNRKKPTNIEFIKNKAKWKPTWKRRYMQYLASLKAILTYPFFKQNDSGVKLFFENNYNKTPDPLLFDGNTNQYLDQITNVLDIKSLNDKDVIDLGCGSGSFLFWLEKKGVNPRSYLGLDFAHENKVLSSNKKIINQNIFEFEMPRNHYVVLINVACYLGNKQLDDLLKNVKERNCKLIIIDPHPNFFWDKHFNGIKPHYRMIDDFLSLVQKKGYRVEKVSMDYFGKLGRKFVGPVSFCIFAN